MEKPKITPMMAQYQEIKSDYPDALLFYRMGDFYELFFEDAEQASAALDITLTKRGKHDGNDIPMCGVPVHAAEGYLLTLIRKGFRVAVCEQTEDPAEAKKRGSKSVVRREVVRLVTPGTLSEDVLLETRQHNYLAAYAEIRGDGAFAWVDMSTGELNIAPIARVSLGAMLARLTPREVLVCEADENTLREIISEAGAVCVPLSRASFDSQIGESRLAHAFNVQSTEGFGSFSRVEVSALGAIIDYLDMTQKGHMPILSRPHRERPGGLMQIDAATRRNLELVEALSGGRAGSLLAAIDKTLTGAGGRLLGARLNAPSTELSVITARLDAVAHVFEDADLRKSLRQSLRQVPDLERALSRLGLDRGGPRDLTAIRDTLAQAQCLADLLQGERPDLIVQNRAAMAQDADLISLLDAALVAEPPFLARDGGFVAAGYDAELDETRQLRNAGRSVIADLQRKYSEQTGITALKVKHNNVLGYFIETPATHAQKMLNPPHSEDFVHRQTTANAVRFTTLELSEIETRILNASGHALALEKRIFETLRQAVLAQAAALGHLAKALAELDISAALAELARAENWVRPNLDNSRAFAISGGRHPVVEQALRSSGQSFVANDCDLSTDTPDTAPIWLLTGPNMAGKSTFLRQNALIALLAQMGAFVPAQSAHIGIVDQLFSRVGAADDLARGRSTFMVEMVETAAILNQSGPRALVILDEIGRGTATYDGLSIAWAVLEHLHDVNTCRALFATHYHELTALSGKLDGLRNATVAVREWEGEVIFLHEVRPGAADRSYGVQVAVLAGLPALVTDRARIILDQLEAGEREAGGKAAALIDDLPLFSTTPAPQPARPIPSPALERLDEVAPDELTPRAALSLVYELKSLASGSSD